MRRVWRPLPNTFIGALMLGALSGTFMWVVFAIIDIVSPWPVGGSWLLIPIAMVSYASVHLVKKHR